MLSPLEYTVSLVHVLIFAGPPANAWLEAILSNLIVSFSFLIFELDNTACAFASVVTAPPPPSITTVGVSM